MKFCTKLSDGLQKSNEMGTDLLTGLEELIEDLLFRLGNEVTDSYGSYIILKLASEGSYFLNYEKSKRCRGGSVDKI